MIERKYCTFCVRKVTAAIAVLVLTSSNCDCETSAGNAQELINSFLGERPHIDFFKERARISKFVVAVKQDQSQASMGLLLKSAGSETFNVRVSRTYRVLCEFSGRTVCNFLLSQVKQWSTYSEERRLVLIETIENCGCNEVVSDLFKILASKRSTIAETRKLLYALATFKATGTKEALESFETRCPSLLERDFSRVLNWVNGATLPRNAFKDPRNVLSELLEAVKSHDYEKYVSCFPHDLAASFDKPDVEREVFQDKLAVQSISEIMHSLLTDREVQKLKSKKRIRFFTAEHLVELVQEFGEWKIVSFH